MYTKIGNRVIYDNFQARVADNPNTPDQVYLVFTEADNETTHMFSIAKDQGDAYIEMLRTALKGGPSLVIAGAHEMPKEQH